MAKEGRNLVAIVIKNFIDSFKPRQFRGNLIGKDYLGNEYYEIPRPSSGRRSSRWFVPKSKEDDHFDTQLPSEWESWLRFRRREPPTEAEIAENLALMKSKKIKAAEIDKKFGIESKPSTGTSYPALEGYEQMPGKKTQQND